MLGVLHLDNVRFPIFRERFSQLRGDMKQDEFAEFLGFSRPTVALYESGKRVPDAVTLKTIAEKCGVSADWLLGLSDVKTNIIDLKNACEYTGLSPAAVEAIREVNFAFGNNENFQNVSSGFFTLCWREFVNDLSEMLGAISYADFVLEEMDNPESSASIGATSETIENLERELKIAIFSFSERCRYISDRCGSRDVLESIQKKKWLLNGLILDREVADDGQHIEASDN